jgi:excisionase family DNA binding protein
MAEPLVYTAEETAKLLKLGRTACFEAIRRGDIPSVRIGRSIRIPRHALKRMLGVQEDDDPGQEPGPPANLHRHEERIARDGT